MSNDTGEARRGIDGFVERWKSSGAAERANYQLFLSELCDVLGVARPNPAGPVDAENGYVFERSITFRHGDGSASVGRIDLYKRGCFVLEAKQGVDRGQERPSRWPSGRGQRRGAAPPCAARATAATRHRHPHPGPVPQAGEGAHKVPGLERRYLPLPRDAGERGARREAAGG